MRIALLSPDDALSGFKTWQCYSPHKVWVLNDDEQSCALEDLRKGMPQFIRSAGRIGARMPDRCGPCTGKVARLSRCHWGEMGS